LSGALKNLNNPDAYSVKRKGNYFMQILKDKTGREVGRGCLQKDAPVPVIAPVVETKAESIAVPAAAVAATAMAAAATVSTEKVKVEEVVATPPPAKTEAVDIEDDYMVCAEYEGKTVNDKANNVAMFKHKNGLFYFAIYNADGSVRMRSEGFTTSQNRDQELSGALKNLNNPDSYTTIKRGEYYMQVLKDKTGREVGRSCLHKDEPKAVVTPTAAPVAAVATAAVAAAAAAISIPKETKSEKVVEVAKPIVEVTKSAKVAAPIVETMAPVAEEVAAGGSSKWIWGLLGLAALAGLGWWLMNRNTTPEVVAPTVTMEAPKAALPTPEATAPTPAPAPKAVATGCAACAANADDAIFTSVCTNPKKLNRLGSNPEFGNSHALSPEEFYNKLKKAHADNEVDKAFLDRIFKGMGYASFADAKASQFSAVVLPVGTTGRLGYSKAHKTGCYTLPDDEYHRKAFRIEAANGCTFHFMKTCGNHFFFCAN
jgi:hypothetical protein